MAVVAGQNPRGAHEQRGNERCASGQADAEVNRIDEHAPHGLEERRTVEARRMHLRKHRIAQFRVDEHARVRKPGLPDSGDRRAKHLQRFADTRRVAMIDNRRDDARAEHPTDHPRGLQQRGRDPEALAARDFLAEYIQIVQDEAEPDADRRHREFEP